MKQPILRLTILLVLVSLLISACTVPSSTAPGMEQAAEAPAAGASPAPSGEGTPAIPEISPSKVKFCHSPYLDHTQSIIGLEKGWFEELGIAFDPEPYGNIPSTENLVQALASGACDVASASAVFMLPSAKDVPPFKWWVHGDIFQGYALMAQPDAGYKSVDEFMAEGKSPDEAMQLASEQMKGKRFAYPPEAAIKGFIDLALSKAGMSLEDVTPIVAEDAKTWAMMIADQADFQVGGVPSRLTLETRGFKPIITSEHLAQFAKPSADSVELRSVFQDGWGSMGSWIDTNYDTMMRMASVMFRIAQFQNTNRDEAIAIHVPFLNSAAGTDITPETAVVVYESLHPFVPFDGQAAWYLDESNPLNYDYVTGSYIKMWEEKGLFAPGEIKVSDISMAKDVYQQFLDLKAEADTLFPEAEAAIAKAKDAGKDTTQSQELLDKARYWYDAFDYLDAVTWAKSAIEWAQYEAGQ